MLRIPASHSQCATAPRRATPASSPASLGCITATLCALAFFCGYLAHEGGAAVRNWGVSGDYKSRLPYAAPLLPPNTARTTIDALRSTPAALIPQAAHHQLAALGLPGFVDDARASPVADVIFPISKRAARVSTPNSVLAFWQLLGTGNWELLTFRVYNSVLATKPGVVIDFGSWIGPTVLTAAHAPSTRVYGFEVDPVAFTQLALNVALNADVAAKTSVFFMGISGEAKVVEFSSGACTKGMGDSCSSAIATSLVPTNKWSVQTMPLAAFVAAEGIRLEDISLIKVDTEGAELFILPSLAEWVRGWPGGVKPAIWLSLHGKFLAAHPEWRAFVTPFMQQFAFGFLASGDVLVPQWTTLAAAGGPADSCSDTCTYLLSDVHFRID